MKKERERQREERRKKTIEILKEYFSFSYIDMYMIRFICYFSLLFFFDTKNIL